MNVIGAEWVFRGTLWDADDLGKQAPSQDRALSDHGTEIYLLRCDGLEFRDSLQFPHSPRHRMIAALVLAKDES